MTSIREYKGFVCESNVTIKGRKIHKFKSKKTGLRISLAEVDGPLVHGYFTIKTEASDNDGCPHVLEHLIFLGSEDYPYKGLLDKLANRCFAQGTNAWTSVDHTSYTVTTAGREGFLNLLPTYLDHILYPTLTDAGFTTEVHHIDEKGDNAGVVYCEMQSSENTGGSLSYFKLTENMYKGSGYSWNTGGKLENFRKLKVETVRNYHKKYYRPNNMCVVITGKISIKDVIDAILPIENKILKKKIKYDNKLLPFTKKIPEFTKSIEASIDFPSNDKTGGRVYIGWRTSIKWGEFLIGDSLLLLLDYLTQSSVSPFMKMFVENKNPDCSNVGNGTQQRGQTIFYYLYFSNVQTGKLKLIKNKMLLELEKIKKNGIDMKRMKSIIKQHRLYLQNNFEEEPHDAFSDLLIEDFIYGSKNEDFQEALQFFERLTSLEKKTQNYWGGLLQKYLLENPFCCVIANPSENKAKENRKTEEERIKKQKEELGVEGLKKLVEKLEKAKKENSIEIPHRILKKWKIPDSKSITNVPVASFRSNENLSNISKNNKLLAEHINKNSKEEFPFFIQIDSIQSDFVQTIVYLDTSSLSDSLRLYLQLYLELMFELGINGEELKLSKEEVVFRIWDEAVDYFNGCGLTASNFSTGSFSQFIRVSLKFEKQYFDRLLMWMKHILYFTVFTEKEIGIKISKLLSEIEGIKKKARFITRSGIKFQNYSKSSNSTAFNFQIQENFLKTLSELLKRNPKKVISDLNELRNAITHPSKLKLHLICNAMSIDENIKEKLVKNLLPKKYTKQQFKSPEVKYSRESICANTTTSGGNRGKIFGLASTDSAYLYQTCSGPKEFDNKDIPALLVLIEYLEGCEGPFWINIRGKGLSYNYGIHVSIEEGLLYFILSRSTSLFMAYKESKKIIDSFLKKEIEFTDVSLESSISACIFELISKEETMNNAASLQFRNYLKKLPHDNNKKLLQNIMKVTKNDLYRVLDKYLKNLFDKDLTNISIATNPLKTKHVAESFTKETKREFDIVESKNYFKLN